MASTESKKICIVGTGGFGRETLCCLIDSIKESGKKISDIACFMERDEDLKEKEIMGIPVIPQSTFDPLIYDVVVTIGDPSKRKKVVNSLPENTTYATIIHPNAVISEWVEIGEGSLIMAGCIITCNIKIGKHAQLNLHSTVGHDCQIGDFFTSAPAANISGSCTFGNCVYFGTKAAVKQGIKIIDNVTIGMGGVVVKDIMEEGTYIGNPLRKLEKK
jgi:sugar O-acyltransferase (sialic acid O-acetyltransferase NeuD family)